jgi:hypothetical protein
MLVLATALVLALGGSAPVRVTVVAPGHTPRIGPRWYYTVRVTSGGKPAAARLTEQIVDPLGGTHPVQFGPTTKDITNWPFRGKFRDYILWPKDARGIPLTFRVVVTAGGKKHVVDYRVTPHA